MAEHNLKTIALVFLVITLGIWLTAMFTPGWLILTINNGSQAESVDIDLELSLFYVRICSDDICSSLTFEEVKEKMNRNLDVGVFIEIEGESIIAATLCLICCILLMIPDSCACKRTSISWIVFLFSGLAVLCEAILIVRMTQVNIKVHELFDEKSTYNEMLLQKENQVSVKFPYSVVIAGIGLIFGIVGFFKSRSLDNSRMPSHRGLVLGLAPEIHQSHGFTILQETEQDSENGNNEIPS